MSNIDPAAPAVGSNTVGSNTVGSNAAHSHHALEDYMVSRNQVGGKMALATVTASALGAWILFSPPEAGSAFGGITAILGYCLGSAAAVFTFVLIGPRLRQIMPWGHSLNDYVRHRFSAQVGPAAQSSTSSTSIYLLTVTVMLLYMFVYLAAELTAIAQALQLIVNVPLLVTSVAVMATVFLYTAYGGLKATILTDAVQFALIVPLLLICLVATVALMGGFEAAIAPVAEKLPELMSLGNIGGLRFGATLMIAIVAAEAFNQGNWQRVYACRDDTTVRRAFLGSALVILPMIFVSGLLGLMAAGLGFSGPTAFFDLLQGLQISTWLVVVVILLALALVMSSLDTLLNGISSVFTVDLLRFSQRRFVHNGSMRNGSAQSDLTQSDSTQNSSNQSRSDQVLTLSRVLTGLVGIPAVAIAAQGYSVLYLFFVADLLCAALLFPILFSLYNRHQTANNAFWSSLLGIAAGLLFFPKPDFSPLFNIPGGGDLLNSFAVALLASTAITLVWNAVTKNNKNSTPFNYSELKKVKSFTSEAQSAITFNPPDRLS